MMDHATLPYAFWRQNSVLNGTEDWPMTFPIILNLLVNNNTLGV